MEVISDPTLAGYNCHLSYNEATVFVGNMIYADDWKAAGETQQKRALITATLLLDRYVNWYGKRTLATQQPAWPRSEVQIPDLPADTHYDKDAVPENIKYITVEYANALLAEDITASQSTGIRSLRVDVISINFDKYDRKEAMPDGVKLVCNKLGNVTLNNASVARLVRA